MSSEWDLPRARDFGASERTAAPAVPRRRDGLLDPIAMFGFAARNIAGIAALTGALTATGLVLFAMVPFPYRATATVLVDPRDPQVTLQEDVLRPIGSDAAILESMVQIMKSDGFLLNVMEQLGLTGTAKAKLTQQQQLEALAVFKRNFDVERKGATYLVELSYKSQNADEAARIANKVAASFADTQNGYLNTANQEAAKVLAERLVELRRKLNASEKAVADFAAQHGILYVDSNNTLEMRQLTELSEQLAVARNATEEARARYEQQAGAGGEGAYAAARDGEPSQLSFLRQQRAQLMQTLEQQSLTYGPRHPRLAQTRQLIAGIERQIADERKILVGQLRGALEVASAQQKKLEGEIARLSSGAVLTEAAEVRLEALRREAAADRDIYEKFLSRNKATDELAGLKSENVRVVSPAVTPLKSSRPPLLLVTLALTLFSAAVSIALVVASKGAGLTALRARWLRTPIPVVLGASDDRLPKTAAGEAIAASSRETPEVAATERAAFNAREEHPPADAGTQREPQADLGISGPRRPASQSGESLLMMGRAMRQAGYAATPYFPVRARAR